VSQTKPADVRYYIDADILGLATFYSLRGGVGLTTALANTARISAARGRRVLCIDLDLEAPGLHTLLGIDEPPADGGALPLLLTLEQGGSIDIRDHVQRVTESDELYCIPAGRLSEEYAKRLRLIDPETWYRESANPLRRLVELARDSSLEPDLVLLDSRTGISPISAPLLFDLSDLAIVCFFPQLQARLGNQLLVRALLNAESRRAVGGVRLTPEPRFLVSPVPPGPSAKEVTTRALEWIEDWLEPAQARRTEETGPLAAEELMHAVAYSPEAAFRDRVPGDPAAREPYEPVADWLEQLLTLGSQLPPGRRAGRSQVPGRLLRRAAGRFRPTSIGDPRPIESLRLGVDTGRPPAPCRSTRTAGSRRRMSFTRRDPLTYD
jgi:MinD-like ATPase involved in chromosome partitioning or flagellar assembly